MNLRPANFKASVTTTGRTVEEERGGRRTTEIIYNTKKKHNDLITEPALKWREEDHSLCLYRWANIVFFFRVFPRPPNFSGHRPTPLNRGFQLAQLEESLNHSLWHKAPHDTIRGRSRAAPVMSRETHWLLNSGASSPEP